MAKKKAKSKPVGRVSLYNRLDDACVRIIEDGGGRGQVQLLAHRDCWYVAEIKNLHVVEHERNKGVGTTLVARAIEVARDCGVRVISAATWADNPYAARCFQHNGFWQIGHALTSPRSGKQVHLWQKVLG